jgi:enoyl-CoA hydratase/carnithine racemase
MNEPTVEMISDNGVAVLTLRDDVRRNAMSAALGDALRARVEELKADASVRAVVLTGANGTFSAGGDFEMLESLASYSFEDARKFMLEFYGRYLSITELAVPTIAAIEGPAIGAGFCVALACDVTIAARDAKLALNFVQLALHPGMGATYLVPRRAGAQRAAELLFSGRRFDGAEAAQLALAMEAVEPGQALSRAMELARSFASGGALAVRDLKRALDVDRAALSKALAHESESQARNYSSAEFLERLRAAKKKPAPARNDRGPIS